MSLDEKERSEVTLYDHALIVSKFLIPNSSCLPNLASQDLVPGWDGIVVPLEECAVAGCRNNDVRIIGAPVLCFFLFLAFAGMDWITRIQKALLVLLLLAQVAKMCNNRRLK